jgi:hypothetical protein
MAPNAIEAPKNRPTPWPPQAHRENCQGEQLARAQSGHLLEQPRDHARARREHEGDQHGQLGEGKAEDRGERAACRRSAVAPGVGEGGNRHEHRNGQDVLDDEPSHGDVPVDRAEEIAIFEDPDEDHGAGDGEGEAEDQPAAGASRRRRR